jgi:hypothetical protein
MNTKTIRARIFVAVTDGGSWIASGESGSNQRGIRKDLVEIAKDMFDPPIEILIVEADIPVPQRPRPIISRAKVVKRAGLDQ